MKLSKFLAFATACYMEHGEREIELIIEDGLGTNKKELYTIDGIALTEHRTDKSRAAITVLGKRKRVK